MSEVLPLFFLALDLLNNTKSLIDLINRYNFNEQFTNDKIEIENKIVDIKILERDNNIFVCYYNENNKQKIIQINIQFDENPEEIIKEVCDYFSLKKKNINLFGIDCILLVSRKKISPFSSIILIAESFNNGMGVKFTFEQIGEIQKTKRIYIENSGIIYDS
jgi:hypothetical protein